MVTNCGLPGTFLQQRQRNVQIRGALIIFSSRLIQEGDVDDADRLVGMKARFPKIK